MPTVTKISELLSEDDGHVPAIVSGKLTRCYKQRSGTNRIGDWKLQNGELEDSSGKIRVVFKNRADESRWKGYVIYIQAHRGDSGLSGLKLQEGEDKNGNPRKELWLFPGAVIGTEQRVGDEEADPNEVTPQNGASDLGKALEESDRDLEKLKTNFHHTYWLDLGEDKNPEKRTLAQIQKLVDSDEDPVICAVGDKKWELASNLGFKKLREEDPPPPPSQHKSEPEPPAREEPAPSHPATDAAESAMGFSELPKEMRTTLRRLANRKIIAYFLAKFTASAIKEHLNIDTSDDELHTNARGHTLDIDNHVPLEQIPEKNLHFEEKKGGK